MNCLQQNPATRRYLKRFIPTMTAYAVALLIAEGAIHRFHPTGALLDGLAVLPAIPIIGIIVVVGLYLAEEKDEFQRNLLIQSMLWGLGGILSLTSVWGFLQLYAHVHPFQPFMTFPLFWCFQGIATGVLRWRYR
jgi:hypothetical protein